MRTPGPPTLQQKIEIAAQITANQFSLKRLNHMASNPKDLYLYLFQLGVTMFLCMSGALFLFLMAPQQGLIVPVLLGTIGLVFCVVAIWEAQRMSVKHIDKTKADLEKTIADLTIKLGIPSEF
jgi:hypothetical protein